MVDNSKSSEEIELENRVKAKIEEQKQYIAHCKRELDYYEDMLQVSKETGNDARAYLNKGSIKYYKDQIKEARSKITALKWVLE